MLRALLAVIVMCGAARAQPMAVSIESTRSAGRTHDHPPAGLGVDLSFGWAGQKDGPDGWSGRIDYEVFPVFAPGKLGGLFGIQAGLEAWRSGVDNWGFSLPVAIVGGVRAFPIRAAAGVGLDAILIDQVDDDTGVGFYAPFAMAKLGFDVFGVQVGADARIGYRWQIGAEDHARWQLSLYAGYTMTAPKRRLR